jgi:hypothetical protein
LGIKYDPVNDRIGAFNIALAISGCPLNTGGPFSMPYVRLDKYLTTSYLESSFTAFEIWIPPNSLPKAR